MSPELNEEQVREVIKAERKAVTDRESKTLAERKYKALLTQYNSLEREHEALTDLLGRTTVPVLIPPSTTKKESEGVPLLCLSDWHAEEEVKPRTIGGKNKYNLDIAKKRATRIFQSFKNRCDELTDELTVRHVSVFLLGDFITGRIHEENIENALLLPLDAIQFAQELLEGGIDFLLNHTPHTYSFFCKVGNHSRITRKVHASTEAGNSLEWGMYYSLMRRYHNEPRVQFHIEPSYLSVVKVLGTNVRFHHGHAVNYGGGVGGLIVPLRKAIHSWNATQRADLDVMGHYHQFKQFSTLHHMVNGSLIGYNAFGERIKGTFEEPIQGFGLIHKKYGFTRLTPLYAE